MKRFRFKLVGLGLAALAGSAVAADKAWLIPDRPAVTQSRPVVPAGGEPAQLPASIRLASATEPAVPLDPIWLPAPKSVAVPPAPRPVDPAPLPDLHLPQPEPKPVEPVIDPAANQAPAVGPRVGAAPREPVREVPDWLPPPIPIAPQSDVEPVPPAPPVPGAWRRPVVVPQPPPTSDSPVPGQIRPMPQPAPPGTIRPRSDELPPPRSVGPVTQPTGKELPVAPPDLMVPDCVVPGKHGTFGSPPIRLSSDYPSLAELCGRPIRDRIEFRGADDRPVGTRGFIEGEYLLWWMPGLEIPILGTSSTDPTRRGFLGDPTTVTILGPGDFIGSTRHGVRVRGGLWLDDCGSCAIDGSLFVLFRRTADAAFSSSQFGIITRPIFSPNIQPPPGVGVIGQTGEAVAVPNVLRGALTARAESFLWGADLNVRHCLHSGCDRRLMWFLGYRYLNLSEEVSVTENITVLGSGGNQVRLPDPPGTIVFVQDRFSTENHFHGGQVGLTYERQRGPWSIDARASVAIGATHQELDIFGVQTRTRPGQLTESFTGGLLAAGPNLGHFSRNRFSVVPEFTLNVGYQLTPRLKVYAGYNFLYWTNVLRAGEQIDTTVDLTFVPNAPPAIPSGQRRPAPLFRQTDLWVTGLQFGAQWRW
jgi:hypothetical protein